MSTLTFISPADDQEVACTGRETKTRDGELRLTFTCRGINDQQVALLLDAARGFDHAKSASAEFLGRPSEIVVVIDISHMDRSQAKRCANRTISNLLLCMQRTLTGDAAGTGTNHRDGREQTYVNDGRRSRRKSRTGR